MGLENTDEDLEKGRGEKDKEARTQPAVKAKKKLKRQRAEVVQREPRAAVSAPGLLLLPCHINQSIERPKSLGPQLFQLATITSDSCTCHSSTSAKKKQHPTNQKYSESAINM